MAYDLMLTDKYLFNPKLVSFGVAFGAFTGAWIFAEDELEGMIPGSVGGACIGGSLFGVPCVVLGSLAIYAFFGSVIGITRKLKPKPHPYPAEDGYPY